MLRIRQRNIVKMFKDILVTRRDLIDLRQSITDTIQSIRQSDQKIKQIQDRRSRRISSNANHIQVRPILHKCQACALILPNLDQLIRHKEQHHQKCKKCNKQIRIDVDDHLKFYCGEVLLNCEICCKQIKKKDLDNHIKTCCYRQCYKCKKQIYVKAYTYHLLQCKTNKINNLMPPCKKFIRNQQKNHSLFIPCCIVMS